MWKGALQSLHTFVCLRCTWAIVLLTAVDWPFTPTTAPTRSHGRPRPVADYGCGRDDRLRLRGDQGARHLPYTHPNNPIVHRQDIDHALKWLPLSVFTKDPSPALVAAFTCSNCGALVASAPTCPNLNLKGKVLRYMSGDGSLISSPDVHCLIQIGNRKPCTSLPHFCSAYRAQIMWLMVTESWCPFCVAAYESVAATLRNMEHDEDTPQFAVGVLEEMQGGWKCESEAEQTQQTRTPPPTSHETSTFRHRGNSPSHIGPPFTGVPTG